MFKSNVLLMSLTKLYLLIDIPLVAWTIPVISLSRLQTMNLESSIVVKPLQIALEYPCIVLHFWLITQSKRPVVFNFISGPIIEVLIVKFLSLFISPKFFVNP